VRNLPFILAAAIIAAAPTLPAQTTAPATPSRAVVPAADPAEYARRLAALKDDDIEGRLALARWARDRAMWTEAVDLAGAVLYREPTNRAAYLILQQVDDARPLPEEPVTEESLRAEFFTRFGHEFKTRTTKHFLFCYDTTDAFAAGRGAAMERIYQSFQYYFVMGTLRPQFLTRRMVVILLKDREDYLKYLADTERADMSWSAGYYSQRTNRAMYFDDSSGPTMTSYAKQATDLRTKSEELARQIAAANATGDRRQAVVLTQERTRTSEALAQLNLRAGNALIMLNNTKSMHEAAHQVAFNIGVQRRLVDYPIWFSEGLACSFETEDAQGRKGPAVMNYGRIAGIKEALRADRIVPVEAFVRAGSPEKSDHDSLTTFYAESWALFHYLYKYHRVGMEKYLLAQRALPIGRRIEADDRVRMFKEAFGDDLEALNKKFVAYLKSLPATPQG
jgi:hypothetical protein